MPLLSCAVLAITAYHVPEKDLLTIISHQADRNGLINLPSGWITYLSHNGFNPKAIQNDLCANQAAVAWILAWQHLTHKNDSPSPPSPPRTVRVAETRSECIRGISLKYKIPQPLLVSLLKTEGGKVGELHQNSNHTFDIGPAQINSTWLPKLAPYGITFDKLLNDECLNIEVGAWILATRLGGTTPSNPLEFWRKIGNYHSATPLYNQIYQRQIWKNIQNISHSYARSTY